MAGDSKLHKAYEFFRDAEQSKRVFTLNDVCQATGYSPKTAKAYSTKKWHLFLKQTQGGFLCQGVLGIAEDVFARLHAQRTTPHKDLFRPRFSDEVDALLDKCREAAMLAVQTYNNPLVTFRTPGYIVNMIIAYTTLFHAIFRRGNIECWYKEKDGSATIIDGEEKYWELSTCLDKYYKGLITPETANIELFIKLRNKIEHRHIPALDISISGYCQALLLNFERLIVSEFGEYFTLGQGFALALQLSEFSAEQQVALRRIQTQHYDETRKYIIQYHEGLPKDISQSSSFCFRAFLVPILGNHAKSSDISVHFIKYDPNNPEEMNNYEALVAFIREKQIPVADHGLLRVRDVVARVKETTGIDFNTSHHTKAWKLYKARSASRAPGECNPKYCHYSAPFNDFVYTEAWVKFLCEQVSKPDEFARLKSYQG